MKYSAFEQKKIFNLISSIAGGAFIFGALGGLPLALAGAVGGGLFWIWLNKNELHNKPPVAHPASEKKRHRQEPAVSRY